MSRQSIRLGISLGIHPLVGIAALPFLELLRDQDAIQLKQILGSGQGALSAALLAANKSENEMRAVLKRFMEQSHFKKFNKNMAASMLNIGPQSYHPAQSFYSGDTKTTFYDDIFGTERMENMPIPLSLVATDLYTAEPVLIQTGRVSTAVYAASAWFPFHPPVKYQGRLLVSGGFSDSVPTFNDPDLDLELAITIQDPVSWQHTELASDGWAFFERAFQSLEHDSKKKIRKSGETNIIPLPIVVDEPIPYKGVSDEHIDYIYSISKNLLNKVISSKN